MLRLSFGLLTSRSTSCPRWRWIWFDRTFRLSARSAHQPSVRHGTLPHQSRLWRWTWNLDPVANGWAASLAHPGSNITGIFLDLPDFNAKSLQLLREAVPALTKVAVFWHPVSGNLQLEAVRKAAVALNVAMDMFEVSRPADFEPAFQSAAKSQCAGVLMLSSPLFGGNPQLLADLALQHRLPAINIFPDFAQKGGLIGYGPELQNLFTQAGVLVRKILQGTAIADLPVERPTRFRLVANLVTARALGLTVPTSILLSADEVIE